MALRAAGNYIFYVDNRFLLGENKMNRNVWVVTQLIAYDEIGETMGHDVECKMCKYY